MAPDEYQIVANKSRFISAKKAILALFEAREQRVYRERELAQLVAANRSAWRLGLRTGIAEFIELMEGATPLRSIPIEVDGIKKTLYAWGQVTDFEVAIGLVPRAYLSHYTALYLHELTEQNPKQIYINQEQSAKQPAASPLTQADLDAAFFRLQLASRSRGNNGDNTLIMLHGQHTGQLGVETHTSVVAGRVPITSLERTLIDITVRPEYAGGVLQVLDAYRRAADKVSIDRMVSMLAKLAYRYPYHQAIGFYMEKAGSYKPAQLDLLRKLSRDFDFYLAHDMKTMAYSAEWRLHYPSGF